MRYGIEPPDLPEYFGLCDVEFDICHALDCKKGVPITVCHNALHDGVADLVSKAFTPTHVRYDPKIYTGCAVCGGKYKLKGSPSQDVGELNGGSRHQIPLYSEDGYYSLQEGHEY